MEAVKGIQFREPSIFERSVPGRTAVSIAKLDVPDIDLAAEFGSLCRKELAAFPEVAEPEVVRHFVRLSQWNYCIDTQFYPLGSCTMKYNPKINEWAARLPSFAGLHPMLPAHLCDGTLELMVSLQELLTEIVGMDETSLQPAAGAQGELTGMMMIRGYHQSQGRSPKKVFIPESAHGTNPASCAINGYEAVSFKASGAVVDPADLIAAIERAGDDVAAIMITNPNTLGIYEKAMPELTRIIHERGGLVYGDGANMNAVLGVARPGDVGVDVIQYNLHKTFTTPHGGGGPGSGPVSFKKILSPFQPGPVVRRGADGLAMIDSDRPQSIGRMRSFYGNFGMMIRAYTYIRELGPDGLRRISELAVLNANYLAAQLKKTWPIAFNEDPMHEAIFTDRQIFSETGVKTLDIAKRLIDYGYHPPTVYFPLIVSGAMMIEPTETETKDTIDQFVDAMNKILTEARENPELVKTAPHLSRLGRLDEARAARKPRLRWTPEPIEA